MLRKLFKHDMKEIGRIVLPMTIVVAITSILGALGLRLSFIIEDPRDSAEVFVALSSTSLILVTASIFALIAYIVGVYFVVLRRYYTNLFTDEGYLTFTLPCKESTHILSKLFSGILWTLISMIIFSVCIFVFILGIPKEEINVIKDLYRIFINIDIAIGAYDIIAMISSTVSMISSLLMMYLAITIGATVAKKHKIWAAIGFYYLINFVIGIFTSVIRYTALGTSDEIATVIYLVFYSVLAVVFFIINKNFLKNKLNLA